VTEDLEDDAMGREGRYEGIRRVTLVNPNVARLVPCPRRQFVCPTYPPIHTKTGKRIGRTSFSSIVLEDSREVGCGKWSAEVDWAPAWAMRPGRHHGVHPVHCGGNTFVRREDAERFIEEGRGGEPQLARYLRIEERLPEA
jgi:hypothetical protein